ncbi:hypothetical protein Are01nite_69150 [Actinoplanes regularis]|nr:hypothetical protein Are01nite_69150 [Actinoplanes regularis]
MEYGDCRAASASASAHGSTGAENRIDGSSVTRRALDAPSTAVSVLTGASCGVVAGVAAAPTAYRKLS